MRSAPVVTLLATLLASGGSLLLSAPAHAYVRSRSHDGQYDLIWPDPRITLTVHPAGSPVSVDDFVAAATRSAATWSDPALATSVAFTVESSDASPPGAVFDHQNTIAFRADSWDPPMYSSGQLAVTTVWAQGARIVDIDTEINAVDPMFTWALLPDDPVADAQSPDVDLQNALTHELGHALGLDHPCYLGDPPDPPEVTNEGGPVPSCSDPALPASVLAATMYPSAKRGTISARTLSPDEVLALHDLYPAGQAPVVEGPTAPSTGGCAVAGGTGAPGASSPEALGGLTLLALLFARRSARRAPKARRLVDGA